MMIPLVVYKKYIIPALTIFIFSVLIIFPLCFRSQLWIDEVLDSDPAYNFAFHNKIALSVWEGIYRVEERFYMRPPLYFVILGQLFKTFGVKRWVTLSLSLIPAALAFCIVYIISMLLIDDFWISIVSALLLGSSALGVGIAKYGRTEALALFFFTVSLLVFLISLRCDKWLRKTLLILSGAFLGFATQCYQLYGILFISFIFYCLFELRNKSKNWFKEMVIFSLGFMISLSFWIAFILEDFYLFKTQELYHLNIAKYSSNSNAFFLTRLSGIFFMAKENSPLTVIFLIIGNIFFVKRFPQYKKLVMGFVLLPAFLLLLLNLLKGNYIEIFSPLAFIGVGFFSVYIFRKSTYTKKPYFLKILLFLFVLFHLSFGIGARYFMIIKDWQIRDLDAYEKELVQLIPAGSVILGGPENWYALINSGSRLLLFDCIYEPAFNWGKVDYVVVPVYYKLQKDFPLSEFLNERCTKIANIGKKGYDYSIFNDFIRQSGYASIVFKVRK